MESVYGWSLHQQLLSLREIAAFILNELRITTMTHHKKETYQNIH